MKTEASDSKTYMTIGQQKEILINQSKHQEQMVISMNDRDLLEDISKRTIRIELQLELAALGN